MTKNNVKQDMQNNMERIFCLAKYHIDDTVCDQVWSGVLAHNKKVTRVKLWIFSSTLFVSVAGLIPLFITVSKDLTKSGFYEYFSLIFSDIGSVVSLWKEFGLLLAESLPILSITLTLSIILIATFSLRNTMKQIIIRRQLSF